MIRTSSHHRNRFAYRSIVGSVATTAFTFVAGLLFAAALPWLSGRDIAESVFRAREPEGTPDPDALENIRRQLDLPSNPLQGMGQFFTGLIHLDGGPSWANPSTSAWDVVVAGVGPSLFITFTAVATGTLIACGVVWPRIVAYSHGRSTRAGLFSTAVLSSLPGFVVASLVINVVAIHLQWFPATGWDGFNYAVLPVASMSIPIAGVLSRILLIAVDTAAAEPWVTTWLVNGIPAHRVRRSLIRRGFATLTPQIFLFFAGTLASTALVENIFSIPGLGRIAVDAATQQNVPVMQALLSLVLVVGAICGFISKAIHYVMMRPIVRSHNASLARTTPHINLAWWAPFVMLIPLSVGLILGAFRSSAITPGARLQSPSLNHPLGTDQVGRDVLGRMADGAIPTIGIAVITTAVCVVIGMIVGLVGPWGRALGDTLNALPVVFIGIVLASVFGTSVRTSAGAIMAVGWIPIAAHCHTLAAEVRRQGHYEWARDSGAQWWRLFIVHTLPFVAPAALRHGATRVGHNILALAGLAFLGIGAGHDSPQWGTMLSEAMPYAGRAWWFALSPTIALVLIGLATTLIADHLAAGRGSQ